MTLTTKTSEAFEMAVELHGDQTRKGSDIPYLGHILGVTSIVIDDDGSEAEVIAALLHDGPEDSGGLETLARIREQFGLDVAEIVDALSDTFDQIKPEWRPRKEQYLDHLRNLPDDDLTPKILRVSLADKLHNARSILLDRAAIGEKIWDRFTAEKSESLWYYETLGQIYQARMGEPTPPLVLEFLATVKRLKEN